MDLLGNQRILPISALSLSHSYGWADDCSSDYAQIPQQGDESLPNSVLLNGIQGVCLDTFLLDLIALFFKARSILEIGMSAL